MRTIEELKSKKQDLEKKLRVVRDAIDKVEQDILLPSIKEKYEGKYFKYENRYDGNDSWWMYFYVSKVKTPRHAEGIEFQKDLYGQITIKKEKDLCLSLLQVECTKSEFDKNIKITLTLLNSYLKP